MKNTFIVNSLKYWTPGLLWDSLMTNMGLKSSLIGNMTRSLFRRHSWHWSPAHFFLLAKATFSVRQFLTFPPRTISHVSTSIDFPSIFSSCIIYKRSQCAISWDVIILTSNLSHITHFMIAYVMGNHNVEKFSYIENNHFFKRRTILSFAFARLMMRVLIWQMKRWSKFFNFIFICIR